MRRTILLGKNLFFFIQDVLLTPRRLTEFLCYILAFYYVVYLATWYASVEGLKLPADIPLGSDFINVYAAGVLVHQHTPEFAYDWNVHHQTMIDVLGFTVPFAGWLYPPPFLLMASLLAWLPFAWAFGVYILTSFLAYMGVMVRLAQYQKELVLGALAFPGVFTNIIAGQNGFITSSLFGAGLLWLETNPWRAGLMFGLMSYKPQFFILIPFLLAVGGYGRALVSTLLTAILTSAMSWFLLGSKTWEAFLNVNLGRAQHDALERGLTGWQKIQSFFSLARMWGVDVSGAYVVQGLSALLALSIAVWVWRSSSSLATRAATLCGAILLTTPYLLDYDLVILAVPLMLLTQQGLKLGFVRFEKWLLGALWVLPPCARLVGSYHVLLTPFLLAGMMVVCVAHQRDWRQQLLSSVVNSKN